MDNCLNVSGDASKLFDAIGKASKKFQPLPKNKPGQYGNQKFDYAPYHTIRKCILNHLLDEGVTFIQPIHSEGTSCAVTLIVSGHGSLIQTTLKFEMNSKPQDFGKESTYYRRYQLQSFFCLEGDKDADDLEDPISEVKEIPVEKVVAKREEPATVNEPVKGSDKPRDSNIPSKKTEVPKSVNDALIGAMKQLNWEMPKMNDYCRSKPELFPNFVKATALSETGKATLLVTLAKEFDLAPF
jgi:hypothetical protein